MLPDPRDGRVSFPLSSVCFVPFWSVSTMAWVLDPSCPGLACLCPLPSAASFLLPPLYRAAATPTSAEQRDAMAHDKRTSDVWSRVGYY